MNPIIYLLTNIIDLINLALLVWIVLGLLIYFKIANRSHPFVSKLDEVLTRIFEPILRPIRKALPDLGGVDISPIIVLLALDFLKRALIYYF